MKIRTKKILIVLLSSFAFISSTQAQSDLEINKVFEHYGTQKDVIMLEFSGEMGFPEGLDLNFFKSISISNNATAGDFIRKCLKSDEQGARKVKQVVANGIPTSIFLQLPPKNKLHRLILFNEKFKPEHKITLIYIESKNNSEDVLKLILKKND